MIIRKLIYIVITMMMVVPSVMLCLPYPTYALSTNLTVAGESGYSSGTSSYNGGAIDFTNLNSNDDATTTIGFTIPAERAWSMSTSSVVGTISYIQLYYKDYTGSTGMDRPFIRISGVNYYGTAYEAFNVWTMQSDRWYTNPATGLPWTNTAINAAYFGVQASAVDEFSFVTFVTYVYVEVNYTPAPPTVTTSAATSVGVTTVTLNGAITNTGGVNADYDGFAYGTVSQTLASTNVTPPNGYTSNATTAGNFTVSSFNKAITGLVSGSTYYFRAYAHNTYGWNYGSELSFTTVSTPSVNTLPATGVTTASAQLNGSVAFDGSQACDVRFGYGLTSQAATLAGFNAYDTRTAWANNTYVTGMSIYVTVSGLTLGSTYYYNIQIENDAGIGYGVEGSFVAYSAIAPPTNFIAISNSNSVTLVWTKGSGAATTYIKYTTSSYPATTADGMLVYSGALASFTHSNLTAGTVYYYSAWSSSAGFYSATYATAMGTTTAGVVPTTISVPTVTGSKWVMMPSEMGLVNFPLYTFGNWIADTYSMPRATFWVFSYLMLVVFACMVVYMKAPSNNLLLSGITGVILLGFGTIPTPPLIPIWSVFSFIIILVVIGWVVNRY